MLRYFFSISALAVSVAAFAQKDNAVNANDTVKNKYLPTGLRVGTDAISIIKSDVVKNWKGYEFNADLDFDRYYLAIDYGHWARTEILSNGTASNNGNYSNSGNYFRVGGDMNFMLKDPEKNMFFLGLRYGTSNFKEALSYSYTDSLPPQTSPPAVKHSRSETQQGLVGHWIELTTGLRVRIWGPFWMGYTARLKLAPSVKGATKFNSYDIPGYGLADRGNYWGINYQLFWRIPVRKVRRSGTGSSSKK